MSTYHLISVLIMSLASTLSGFGVGFLWGFCRGTNTVNGRLAALLAGIFSGLAMMFAQSWLAYVGPYV